MKPRKYQLIGLVAVIALATGCGKGIALQSRADTWQSTRTVLIGAPYPLTGIWAENGQNCLRGMRMAADQINAAGGLKGLHGAKIKVISADTGSTDPGQAKTVTTAMLMDNHLTAIVGAYLSSMTLTAAISAESERTPIITQSYVDKLTESGYKYLFQIAPSAGLLGKATVVDLKNLATQQHSPLRTVAMLDGNDASAKAQAKSVTAAARRNGLRVNPSITYPDGLSDASSIVSGVAAANPDAIVLGGSLSDAALIIKALRGRGINKPIINPGGGGTLTPQFASTLGRYAEGVFSTTAWNADLKLPGVGEVARRYQAKYGVPMPQEAGESWVALHMLAKTVNTVHSSDPKKVRDALSSTTYRAGPASAMPPGKVRFDPTGRSALATPLLVQWQHGKLHTVYPNRYSATKPLPFP